jgi:hypothetical protein
MKHRLNCLSWARILGIFLVTGMSLVFASCWHPPFSPEVSASLLTSEKLGKPVWQVKVRLPYNARGGYYLPSRYNYNSGMWTSREPDRLQLMGFWYDSALMKGMIDNYIDIPVQGITNLLVLPSAGNQNVFFFTYPGFNRWGSIDYSNGSFNASPSYDGTMVGTGFRFGDDGANDKDTLYWAAMSNNEITLYELAVDGNDTTFNSISTIGTYSSLPPVLPAAISFAALGPDNGLYISGTLQDGSVVTYRWKSLTENPEQLQIDKPLTGMLADGRLMADTRDRLYIYTPDGSSGFVISTGAMHFSYERYDSAQSRWIAVFTRTLEIPVSNSDGWDYLISVYEIPADQLETIAFK